MKSFVNKKILLLCKETFSYPLYFLAERWKKENKVAAFFFMPPECKYAESELNGTTYYAYRRLEGITVFDVTDTADTFTKNKESTPIDWEFIDRVEREYTYFKPLNYQLMSSQFTTSAYHYRNYYSQFTQEQQVYWLELNYKKALSILDEFQPDVIIDCDDAELPRTIINEIAYRRNIPYITLEHPRYENYKLFTFQMGIGVDSYFKKTYRKNLKKSEKELANEIRLIDEYRMKKEIMAKEFKGTITSRYERGRLIDLLKSLYGKIIYFNHQDSAGKNRKLKKENPLIYPNSFEYIKFYFRTGFLNRKLLGENKYFSSPVENEKYVYMPLHLIPESTTFVKAPIYVNELQIIEAASKALPVGWKLYVKEHQAMLGERSVEFYKMVNRLPNAKMVSVNYYADPKPWITNAQGVITIVGTSAFEAAMLGKKAIIFGDVPFSLIEGIERTNSLERLKDLIPKLNDPIDNKHSCAAYISSVKEEGFAFAFKYLLQEGENIMFKRSQISEKYQEELNKLEMFYMKAYHRYQEREV